MILVTTVPVYCKCLSLYSYIICWRFPMAKRLRGDTQIWLFGKCPPVVNEEKQIKITSARPPTVADVFLNYCGQHQYLQNRNKATIQ